MILALLLLASPPAAAPAPVREVHAPAAAFRPVLEAGRRDRRPVVLRVKGQDLSVTVVRLQEGAVEVRRADHSRLLIRLDRIEAAALR